MRIITLMLCFLTFSSIAQNIDDNLLLHYSFNGTMADQSNNGHDATAFNIVYGPDRDGNAASAAYFNGTNSYVNFPNLSVLKPDLPVSFTFWIKYDSAAFQQQVVFNTSYEENHATSIVFNATGGTNQYAINFADGQYFYGPSSRRSYVSNLAVDTSEWKHISIVVNSATDMKIYIDCEEAGGTYSGTGGPVQYSFQPGCLGRHDRSLEELPGYFKGFIDDFRYWDRALTPNDVAVLCTSLATEEIATKKSQVYPNPTTGMLTIDTDNVDSIMIFDSAGRKVYSSQFTTQIDISAMPAGIYLVKLVGDNLNETHKIILH